MAKIEFFMIPLKRSYPVLIFLVVFLSHSFFSVAQTPTQELDSVNKKKLNRLVIASSVGYTASMVVLSKAWYSEFDRQPFSFFDDSKEWFQVDKIGHFYSAFHLSNMSANALIHTGLSKRKSQKIGALSSFLMVSSIEIFDGYSAGYGASASDLVANAVGSSVFLGQQLLWNETRIYPKFSFHTTHLANQRPTILGSNFSEKVLKDYNGQTYWMSIDVDRFTRFPKWLNLAIGYGAHDFIFASKEANISNGYSPYRQYYLSIDFDLTSVKTNSKPLKALLYLANMIKLPSPTLEFTRHGVKSYAFYF
ncbi:MAG TPA: DUF2279 domain-containing protein [Cytophagales bacterium]|nr:DUF2279 domain-containing protein [Cytophagales bacterium]